MDDPRIQRLAETLIDHSCRLVAGDKVLIEGFDLPDAELIFRLVELASKRGALPVVSWKNNAVLRTLYQTGTQANLSLIGSLARHRMEQMDAYIRVAGAARSNGFGAVPRDRGGQCNEVACASRTATSSPCTLVSSAPSVPDFSRSTRGNSAASTTCS